MPNQTTMRFIWNHERLSIREDMLVNAVLTLFMMNIITQRQAERGGGRATSEDAVEAIRLTIEWAARTFPDLDVRYSSGEST